jgi:integrase
VDTGTKVTPRRRQICENEDAAKKLQADWQEEYKRGGSDHSLSPAQRHDALQALSLMEKKHVNASLSDAVQYFLKHRYPGGGDITVLELVDHFVSHKQAAQRTDPVTGEKAHRYSSPYLNSLHKLDQLGEAMTKVRLSNLKPADIEAYLDKMRLNDVSRYHYFQYFKMLFNYGVKHEFLERNPMAKMQSPLLTRRDPRILTVDQADSLLDAAYRDHDGATLVYIVLGLFGGIRPHEIMKLKWSDFRDEGWSVRLRAETAKTRDVRVANLPVNATHMISDFRRAYRQKHGSEPDPESPVVPMTQNLLRKRFRQAYRLAGLKEWPHDAARHTFASFYYKATKSMPLLMEQLGHATPVTSLRHYVNLTDESWISYFTLGATKEQEMIFKNYVAHLTDPDPIPDNPFPRVREKDALRLLLHHDWSVLPEDMSRIINPERDTII